MINVLFMAYLSGLAAAITGGIIGSYVVVKRIVFISGSIAHSVLGGMGLCLFFQRKFHLPWLDPLYGALAFALLAAYLIGWIHLSRREREDTVIGAIWASGMAIGALFLSLTPGYNVEVTAFLFGNILWSSTKDLLFLSGFNLLVVIATLILHRPFLAICFDETQAYLQGLPVKRLYFILLSLVAIAVVLLVKIVGAILVVAILSLPAAIAGRFTSRLSHMIFLAIAIAIVSNLGGLALATSLNWPPGATIALVATTTYFLLVHLFH